MTVDPKGATGYGFSTTPYFWLKSELSNPQLAHAIEVQLVDSSGVPVTGAVSVTAAPGFSVGNQENGTFGPSSQVYFSNGKGLVYLQASASGYQATASQTSLIPLLTTLFTVGNQPVSLNFGVSTLYDFNPNTYPLLSGESITSSAAQTFTYYPTNLAAPAPSAGETSYYYLQFQEAVPNGSNSYVIQIAVPYGGVPVQYVKVDQTGTVTLEYQVGTPITYAGETATIVGTFFNPTFGAIYTTGVAEVVNQTTPPASVPSTFAPTGYVRSS